MSKNVLIVSYTFPPTGGAGVQRISKIVKYLRDFGWEPIVLTAQNPSVPLMDTSLLKDIPKGVRIVLAKTFEPSYTTKQGLGSIGKKTLKGRLKDVLKNVAKSLLLPDAQILWWPDMIRKINAIIKANLIDCIFVTSPPYSVLIPTVFFAKLYKVPVVVDFRDEWSFSRDQWENSIKNLIAHKVDAIFESYVLRNSTKFTAATQSYVDSILLRHPKLDNQKGYVLTNGYDEDDISSGSRIHNNDKITFAYTGTVWSATSLRPFMRALNRLASARPELVVEISVKIIGRIVDSELDAFTGSSSKFVKLIGYVEHKEAIREIEQADILVLSLSELPGAGRIYPGKLFEYMATGKHILGIVPDGETKELLVNHYVNSTVVSPVFEDEIFNKLIYIIHNIETIRSTKRSDVSRYSRKVLTGELTSIFDRCLVDV